MFSVFCFFNFAISYLYYIFHTNRYNEARKKSVDLGDNPDLVIQLNLAGVEPAAASAATTPAEAELLDEKRVQRNLLAWMSSKLAYYEVNKALCALEAYTVMNVSAITKISSKHDKLLVRKRNRRLDYELNLPRSQQLSQDSKQRMEDLGVLKDSELGNDDEEEEEEEEVIQEEVYVHGENPMSSVNHSMLYPQVIDRNQVQPLSTPELFGAIEGCTTFMCASELAALKQRHLNLYARVFCQGSQQVAKSSLLIENVGDITGKESSKWDAKNFRIGLRIGLVVSLIVWNVWDCVIDFSIEEASTNLNFGQCHMSDVDIASELAGTPVIELWFTKIFPIWRGLFALVLALWCWGGLLWVWNTCRINYLLMLELDPRYAAGLLGTLKLASDLTCITLISFLIHFKVLRCQFPRWPPQSSLGFWPLLPFFAILYHSIFPWVERRQMWTAFGNVCIAPFVSVSFMMNYAGDVMTSLVKPFSDLAYTVCFYVSGDWLHHLGDKGVCMDKTKPLQQVIIPMILLGPYWLRLMQCCRRYYDTGNRHPHLPNAFKYALSMCVTVFGVTNPTLSQPFGGGVISALWTTTYAISTLYSWYWDVNFDWSVLTLKYKTLNSASDAVTSRGSISGRKTLNRQKTVENLAARKTLSRSRSIEDLAAAGNRTSSGGGSSTIKPCPTLEIRSRRMIPKVVYYYVAIFLDLFLRFFWAYTLIPNTRSSGLSELGTYIAPFAAIAEVLRRSMWSVFRLENEHLNNTDGYRKYKHIPLHYALPAAKKRDDTPDKKRRINAEVCLFVSLVLTITVLAIVFAPKRS